MGTLLTHPQMGPRDGHETIGCFNKILELRYVNMFEKFAVLCKKVKHNAFRGQPAAALLCYGYMNGHSQRSHRRVSDKLAVPPCGPMGTFPGTYVLQP